MPFLIPPPNLPLGAEGHLTGLQSAVPGGMPLPGQMRKPALQILGAWDHSTVGTHRAAVFAVEVGEGCSYVAPFPL